MERRPLNFSVPAEPHPDLEGRLDYLMRLGRRGKEAVRILEATGGHIPSGGPMHRELRRMLQPYLMLTANSAGNYLGFEVEQREQNTQTL